MSGIAGNGTQLGYATTAEGAVTDVAEVLQITPGKTNVKDVAYTPLDSTDGHAVHAPGSKDTGEYTFNLPYSPTIRAALAALLATVMYWTVTYPDGGTDTFPGYVNEVGEEAIGPDQLLTTACKIMPTGKPVFAPAGS